jgi:predicted Zn-dependent protease
MRVRPKTIRRLLILLTIVIICVGTVAAWIYLMIRRQDAQLVGLKQSAFRAYEAHDYSAAVEQFKNYLAGVHSDTNDPETFYAFGRARVEVPVAGNRQIIDAIELFQRYLNLAPDDPHDVRHELLKLYVQARYIKNALSTCDKLLAKNPSDLEAIRARAQVLAFDHKFAEALADYVKANSLDPSNLSSQRKELALMAELKHPADELVAHARQLLDQHPNDPRFAALLAVAYFYADNKKDGTNSLVAAAQLPPTDPDTVLQIIALLDNVQRIDVGDDLLARALAKENDPRLKARHLQRLFETSEFAQVADELKDLDPALPSSSPTALAYRAIALYELSRRAEADAIVAALADRKDEASPTWVNVLQTRYSATPVDLATQLKTYQEASAKSPDAPIFHFLIGEARGNLGETDSAIREYVQAAKLSLSWPRPLFRISLYQVAAGRFSDALNTARALQRRAPGSMAGEIAYVLAGWGTIRDKPELVQGKDGEAILKICEAIRVKNPADQETLPTYVALLCRRGQKQQAIDRVKSSLASNPPLPELTLAQLTAVSNQEHLELDQLILKRAEEIHGMTPVVAFARASSLYLHGQKTQAMQLVENLRQTHVNDASWESADARFRDVIGDPGAEAAWAALADHHPDSLRVQNMILASSRRTADRALWLRVIERVKKLTGPDAQGWRIELARYHLAGPASSEEIASDIAAMTRIAQVAPDIAEWHRILANLWIRTGTPENIGHAITELTATHDHLPDDIETTITLADLLVSEGMHDKAVSLLDATAATDRLPLDRRIWCAQKYAELGLATRAMEVLKADESAQNDARGQFMMARLLVNAGRLDEASTAYDKLMASPAASPDQIASAAEFYASTGHPDKVEPLLDRLQKQGAPSENVEIFHAKLDELCGHTADAIKRLTEETQNHPTDHAAWKELAGFYLRHGGLDEADKAAAAGLEKAAPSADLTAMRTQIARVRALNGSHHLGSLIALLSNAPQDPIADQALKTMVDAQTAQEPTDKRLADLRALADRHPSFMPLQELAVMEYIATRQWKEATEVASRASGAAPTDPVPLKLLCRIQTSAGNWQAALSAAQRWRQASLPDPLLPDIEIAYCDLRQSPADPSAALHQLAPYVSDTAVPSKKDAVTPVYCRALISSGKADQAADILKSRISQSPRWLNIWMDLAIEAFADGDAASAWLARAVPLLTPGSVPQQIALAHAWEMIGARFNWASAHENARDVMKPIIASESVPFIAWRQWSLINQSLGNLPEAARALEEYLKIEPKDFDAMNDLAFILFLQGGADQIARADQLVHSAISGNPNRATFYDTLARVELATGKPTQAAGDFRVAIEKDPAAVEAMIGLADLLQSQPGGKTEARTLLTRVNALIDANTPMTPTIRQQWEKLKTTLSMSS